MRTVTLVIKNLSRRKGRSILNLIGLILAITVIVATSIISRSMEIQIGDEVEKYGPNIVVTPRTESISVPYGNVMIGSVAIPESALDRIKNIPNNRNIRVLSPKLYGQIRYGNNSLLLVGLIPDREIELKKWWDVTGRLPQENDEIIVGSVIKTSLGLTQGSTFNFKDAGFAVVGTLSETGSIDDYSVFLSLNSAQALLNQTGKISNIDIGAICNDCPVEVISQQIMDAVPEVKATPVKQAVETRMEAVKQTANFSLLLASIILVIGCAGIMNTMLASIHERMREIGILMSLGADSGHMSKIFLLESLILGLAGGAIGTAVGIASSMLLGPIFMKVAINPGNIPIQVAPLALTLSVSACLIASLYPTWRASKIDPVKALKAV